MKSFGKCVIREESREKAIYQPRFFQNCFLKNHATKTKSSLLSPSGLILKSHTWSQCSKIPEGQRQRGKFFKQPRKKDIYPLQKQSNGKEYFYKDGGKNNYQHRILYPVKV